MRGVNVSLANSQTRVRSLVLEQKLNQLQEVCCHILCLALFKVNSFASSDADHQEREERDIYIAQLVQDNMKFMQVCSRCLLEV
jgi:hypothetical protein